MGNFSLFFVVGVLVCSFGTPASASAEMKACPCPRNLDLNCGVDKKTYSNHCVRDCQGVALWHAGPCTDSEEGVPSGVEPPEEALEKSQPETADTRQQSGSSPAATEGFGQTDAPRKPKRLRDTQSSPLSGDDEADAPQEAQPTREVCACPLNLMLNCGDDNITYANHCLRACKGVTLKHEGPCEGDEHMQRPIPRGDDANDAAERAVKNLKDCACPLILMPTCGTDRMTYSNNCTRECAGVPLLHDGPCDDEDDEGAEDEEDS